jgi:hypothetical protein
MAALVRRSCQTRWAEEGRGPVAQSPSSPQAVPRTRIAIAAVVLEVVLALGALGGGIALMLGPRGEIIPLPLSLLNGSVFASYFVPGLILFVVLGVGPLVVAYLAWSGHPLAPALTLAVGGALLVWLTVEIIIVGYSDTPPLQPIYIGLGVLISLVGSTWLVRERRSHSARRQS